jgi:hypothetical protein
VSRSGRIQIDKIDTGDEQNEQSHHGKDIDIGDISILFKLAESMRKEMDIPEKLTETKKIPGSCRKTSGGIPPGGPGTGSGRTRSGVAVVETSLRGAKRRGNLMPFPRHHEITTALRAS